MRHTILAAAALAVVVAAPAGASVVFTFERISDQQVILRGTGSPDARSDPGFDEFPYQDLELLGVLDNPPFIGPANGQVTLTNTGSYSFGNTVGNTWGVLEGDLFDAFADFADASTPMGSVTLDITGGNSLFFRDIGTTGSVFATYVTDIGAQERVEIGTWQMVAPIPLPAAAWLLLGGVGALASVSRKRRAA